MPADYATLTAAWDSTGLPQGVAGTPLTSGMSPAQKLGAIQGWTVAAPLQDVPVGEVVGYLAIQGKLTALKAYAATSAPQGTSVAGVIAANDLLIVLGTAAITAMRMSDPATAAGIEALLTALAADTGNSGITATDQSALLALAQGTPQRWDRATVAAGGAGLPGYLCPTDLIKAGLATVVEFPGA